MSRPKLWPVFAVGSIVALVGCQPQIDPAPTADSAASSSATQPTDVQANNAAQINEGDPQGTQAEEAPVVAKAGVGKQGQSLKDEQGIGRMIAQPAITLFAVRQRAVFEIQIPQAISLFEALEGRKPKDHDEFMTKIIKANNINLPELPTGQTYRYHPDDGLLYVHPAQ